MKILVTGCAGFIGAKVSEQLIRQGNIVFGIDDLNDAYDIRLKEWRLKRLQHAEKFNFFKNDISERAELQEVLTKISRQSSSKHCIVDAVINLAARAGVRQSLKNPWSYYATNVIGSLNLLEICKEYGIDKFIQASTSSVYGKGERPFVEDQNTDFQQSPYASSKKSAENLCYTYHKLYNIDITILRYFTVYGPAGRPDMSPFRFIKWIVEDEDLIVFGDGNQERDFTYIKDIAEGTVEGLRNVGFEIINLGNDTPTKINEIIDMIEKKVGKKAKIDYKPMHPADTLATWADISKAKKILNWKPSYTLETGLDETINWYLKNRDWVKDIEF